MPSGGRPLHGLRRVSQQSGRSISSALVPHGSHIDQRSSCRRPRWRLNMLVLRGNLVGAQGPHQFSAINSLRESGTILDPRKRPRTRTTVPPPRPPASRPAPPVPAGPAWVHEIEHDGYRLNRARSEPAGASFPSPRPLSAIAGAGAKPVARSFTTTVRPVVCEPTASRCSMRSTAGRSGRPGSTRGGQHHRTLAAPAVSSARMPS